MLEALPSTTFERKYGQGKSHRSLK